MQLQPVEQIHLQQSRGLLQCQIDYHRDPRDFGGQLSNPRRFLSPLNVAFRSRIQIETQSVRSRFDRRNRVGLVSDATNLNLGVIRTFCEEALGTERVSSHGTVDLLW